eukprot:558877-Rhodomonas_salina.1
MLLLGRSVRARIATHSRYQPTSPIRDVRYWHSAAWYLLRAPYTLSGTDIAYGATQHHVSLSTSMQVVSAISYAVSGTHNYRSPLSPMLYPLLIQHRFLRTRDAMSGIDIAYRGTAAREHGVNRFPALPQRMSKRVACLLCRDSKKRCDRTQPCSHCRNWAKANH